MSSTYWTVFELEINNVYLWFLNIICIQWLKDYTQLRSVVAGIVIWNMFLEGVRGVGMGGVMVFSGDKQTMEYNSDLADTGVEHQRKGTSHAVADQIFPTEEGLPDNTNLILQKIWIVTMLNNLLIYILMNLYNFRLYLIVFLQN